MNIRTHSYPRSLLSEYSPNLPAVSAELSGQTASLKEIKKARAQRRKQVQAGLSSRQAVVEQFLAIHQEEPPALPEQEKKPELVGRSKLKGYINE